MRQKEQESWRRWDGESFWAENKELRGRRARSVGVHVRAGASEALQCLKVTLVSFQTLVLLLKEDNLQSGLSLLIPRPSPLIPSLPLSLPYPGLSAFVINPLYHLCRLYSPHSSTVHHLSIIISAILVLSSLLSLLSSEASTQVIRMTLPKALSDPGCQLCQAQIIWALHYRRCCLLALHNPLISLGLGGGWKPALFSNIVIKKDKGTGATLSDSQYSGWSGALQR